MKKFYVALAAEAPNNKSGNLDSREAAEKWAHAHLTQHVKTNSVFICEVIAVAERQAPPIAIKDLDPILGPAVKPEVPHLVSGYNAPDTDVA